MSGEFDKSFNLWKMQNPDDYKRWMHIQYSILGKEIEEIEDFLKRKLTPNEKHKIVLNWQEESSEKQKKEFLDSINFFS